MLASRELHRSAWKEDACIQLWCLRKRPAARGLSRWRMDKLVIRRWANVISADAARNPARPDAWDVHECIILVSCGGTFGNTISSEGRVYAATDHLRGTAFPRNRCSDPVLCMITQIRVSDSNLQSTGLEKQ